MTPNTIVNYINVPIKASFLKGFIFNDYVWW